MARRFGRKRKLNIKPLYTFIVIFAFFIVIFLTGVKILGSSNAERTEDSLRSAMERDIMHCYALEGFYPPSLEYIEEHYGLTYDASLYIVDYQPVGNNIYPNYTIIKKGGK